MINVVFAIDRRITCDEEGLMATKTKDRKIVELPASWAFLRIGVHFAQPDDRSDPVTARDFPAERLDLVIAEVTSCAGLMCPERAERCDTCEHHLPANVFL